MPESDELEKILDEIRSNSKSNEVKRTIKSDNRRDCSESSADNIPLDIVDENKSIHSNQSSKIKNDYEKYNNFSLINDSFGKRNETKTEKIQETDKHMKNKKLSRKNLIIMVVVAVVAIAVIVGAVFAVANNGKKDETTGAVSDSSQNITQEVIVSTSNPLTGESNYNDKAVNKRPVAVVVENASAARPQWGIDDKKNSPDIILEGEVEGGESRMLWFYADYTSLPDQIGPVRSARPPFIKFSQLFDAIFIHWGMSTSKGNYVGANDVFKSDGVDHINQMAYSDKLGLFGRDKSRGVSSEHTGVLYGANLAEAISGEGFRTDIDSSAFTLLSFHEKDEETGEADCNSIGVAFSSRSKTRDWTYSSDDKQYHSTDYETDVARKNILVLFDNTEYIEKSNYKGSGKSEIYCDYKLAGGNGKLASMGTVCDITWTVDNGKLSIKDAQGNDVSLNAGTTWIGWASANNGGTATVA